MICNTCNLDYPETEFRNGRYKCKKCTNEYDKARKIANRLKVRTSNFKVCSSCNIEKCLNDISKVTTRIICKDCYPIYNKEQQKINYNLTYKTYYMENQEKMIEKSSNWNKANKEKKQANNKAYRNRHKDEINFRIKENLSTRLRNLVKKDGKSVIDFLDCSIDFLKMWFEFNFDNEMNWENYGTYWHIDHVTPCAAFDLSDNNENMKCWNWSNLVPLEAKENARKCSKIKKDYIDYINGKKIDFIEFIKKEESSETK